MYAMKWGNPRRVKYECKINLLAKFTAIWFNEHWNDEMHNEMMKP